MDEHYFSGELDAWMNDEVYVPKQKSTKQKNRQSKMISPEEYMDAKTFHGVVEPLTPMYQTSGQISERLASEFNNIVKVESARERARKASREIIKERNDTSGGGKVSLNIIIYKFHYYNRPQIKRLIAFFIFLSYFSRN